MKHVLKFLGDQIVDQMGPETIATIASAFDLESTESFEPGLDKLLQVA